MEAKQNNLLIIDGHEDLAYNAIQFGRDYTRSALAIRRDERGTPAQARAGQCMIGLPELLAGRVAVVFGTLFALPARRSHVSDDIAYHDAEQAHRQAMANLDFYHRWADEEPHIRLIGTQSDLEEVLSGWQDQAAAQEPDTRQVGIVPLMENADPIREPAELEEWFARGLRLVGPAWAGSRYAGGTREPGPLTDLGRELLEVMADLGVGLDLSHMAEQAALEALERFEGVLIASHSNPRALVPTDRHLTDAMIDGIVEKDGVMGVVLCNAFLRPDWHKTDPKEKVTLDDVVRAVDYVCQRVGDAEHVALGSDFDGGFGAERTPAGLDTVADLNKIAVALAEHGYEAQHIASIMAGNWLRVLRRLLPE
jgi:membrane dipeptidase